MSEELKREVEKEPKKVNKIRGRTIFVLVVLAIFIISAVVICRADYLEILEIGEEYSEVFAQNMKYKRNIAVLNFIFVFCAAYITNLLIKKGLRKFFEEEKIEMPKLPNKSLAFVMALVTSLIVSSMFLQKTILFVNAGEFGILDPIFSMDVGFYMFRAPLIGQLLYYGIALMIILTIYTVTYYIIVFNKFFDGIDGQTLRNNTFIKQLLVNAMIIVIFISLIIIFNMQNMVINGFLTLDDKLETTLIGAGVADSVKLWGYRIFSVVLIISVYMAIKSFKKNNTKNILKYLSIVPVYLVGLFIVMIGYKLIFINGNELEKQKDYIAKNIDFTKTAYDIKINETQIVSTGTITDEEAEENQDIITKVPIITENVVKNNLLQTQTSTGYYTYNKAKLAIYNNNLSYISARELDSSHATEEYTHGYGTIIAAATETDSTGNIKYISRDFENDKIKEPRIYYGVENRGPIAVRKWKDRI